jgi:hypothetical protein
MSAATLAWAADAWLKAWAQVGGAPPPAGLGPVVVVVDVVGRQALARRQDAYQV